LDTKNAKVFDEFFNTVNTTPLVQVSSCIVARVTEPETRNLAERLLNMRRFVTSQVVKTAR